MLEPNPNYYKVRNAFYSFWGDSIPKKSYGYKVFKRWEWRALQHMQPDGSIIWSGQQLRDLLQATSSGPSAGSGGVHGTSGGGNQGAGPCPQLGRWSPVGPSVTPWNQTSQPTGIGRIAGMAFHPTDSNTFFICAPQGGVWKTSNNGKSWLQLFGTGPTVNTIGATSMLLSYNNPDTMYVGTGDRDAGDAPGYGVIASWNGGKTWVSRNTGMGNYLVGRMVMHPTNTSILLAATNNGIYRTTDRGANWTRTLAGGAYDVALKPTDPSTAYATIGALFYRSTDNGQTWTQITSGLPSSGVQRAMISVSPAQKNMVYIIISNNSNSGFYGFYSSNDAGLNFTTKSTTPNILGYSETGAGSGGQGWYDLDVVADPYSAKTVYVFGVNVWKSTDTGANWTINAHWVGAGGADDIHADQHAGEFSSTGRKIYACNDGGIYYSSNGGSVWNNISDGIQNSQIYRLAQAQSDPFVTAHGYQDNGSAQSRQDQFYTYYGGDGMDCAVDPKDHSYVYGSYVYGRIYRAIDKTNTLTIGANGVNGINENGGWLTPFILQEGNPARMFAGYNNVWRCDDVKTTGTISWTRITSGFSGTIQRLENSPADNQILYVIDGTGSLIRTDNANASGPTWYSVSSGQPSGLNYVEAHHKNKNIVFGCNSGNLYRSNNKGVSWTSITSISSSYGNAKCLVLDTSSSTLRMYIGTDKGVLVWDSATASLNEFNTGFPIWADVTDLEIYYSPLGQKSSTIVASTYGRGVWRSNLWEDGSAKPKAGFYAFDSVFVVGSKLHLYEKIQGGTSSVTWKITPYTYSYAEQTDSNSLNPIVKFNSPGLYSVTQIAVNCQGTDTAAKTFWIKVFSAPKPANCTNTTTLRNESYGIGIMRFSFADNLSETGGYHDDGAYIDLSASKTFRIKPSTTYTVKMKTGLYNYEYARFYLDYNNNGKFEDFKGEVTSSSYGLGERTFTFTTPATLLQNTGFRLRVLSDFYSLDTNACKSLGYGQGEDYTLVYDKITPLFKVSKTNACQYENIVFTDTSAGFVNQYDWDFGIGAIPATATGKGPHTVKYSSTGLKTVRLRINGNDSLRKNNYVNISSGIVPIIFLKTGLAASCVGRKIILAARSQNGGAFTVQWQKNGIDIPGSTDSLLAITSLSLSDAGAYRAVLSNGGCNAYSSDFTIVVRPLPNPVILVNSANQCQRYHRFDFQSSSSISSGSIVSHNWNYADGSKDTGVLVKHKYAAVGSYAVKLVVTSNFGCSDSSTKTVNLFDNATAFFTVNDSDQCLSGNNIITTNKSSIPTGSLSYLWNFGDGNSSSATSPTKSYNSSGNFVLNLITTSNNGCKDTFSKPVRIYSKPTVSFTLNSTGQCFKGNYFTTTNNSSNTDGSLSYKWKFGDGFTSTSNAPSHAYGSSGNYTIQLNANSSFGCTDSLTKTIAVYPQAKVKFTVNDSDQCLSGNNFVFSNASSISTGSLSYTWFFGDGNTSGTASPVKSYSAYGTYPVLLVSKSNQNCLDSFRSSVRVYSQPNVGFSINNANQCLKGNAFTFANNSTCADGTLSYVWKYDSKTSTASVVNYSFKGSGSYGVRLLATSSFGCTDSLDQTITVFPQPHLSFTVNDTDQCLSNNSFVINNTSTISSGTSFYRWDFGDGTTGTSKSPVKSYLFFGKYNLRLIGLSNNNCSDTLFKPIRVYAQPIVDFSIDNAVQCFRGNRFKFTDLSTVSDGTLTAQWQFETGANGSGKTVSHSFVKDGNYDVKMISLSSFGCSDSMDKSITIYPQANAVFTINDSAQCLAGNQFVFTNGSSVGSGSINAFIWSFGDNASSGTTNAQHSYTNYGIYQVKLLVNSNTICWDSITKIATVYAQPKAKFVMLPKTTACFKYNMFLGSNQSSIAQGSMQYLWNFGDGNAENATNSSHSYNAAGNYDWELKAVSDKGCRDSITEKITVWPSPFLKATPSKILFCENESIQFQNISNISSGSIAYLWKFGQGDTSNMASPNTKFSLFGKYQVLLVGTSNLGCSDSTIVPVEVASNPVAAFDIKPAAGCTGQTEFEFSSTSKNPDNRGMIYHWDLDNGLLDSGISTKRIFYITGTRSIHLSVKSPVCQSDTQRLLVVSRPVSAAFTSDSINKETKRFTALDNDTGHAYLYTWDFGDGTTGSGRNATHTYLENKPYQVRLIVANDIACRDTLIQGIAIKSPNYKNQDNALNFYVYPNPTNGEFTYKFTITESRSIDVTLYDILGQKPLFTKNWQNLDPGTYYETVSLTHLGISAGTYPFKITSDGKTLVIKLVYTK